MSRPDDDGSQSLSPPRTALSHSPHSSDNPPQSSRASRSGDITSKPKNQSHNNDGSADVRGLAASRPSSEGRPSPSAFIRKTLPEDTATGGDHSATSGRDSRTRVPRPAENRTIGIPAAASSAHKTTVMSIDKVERGVERSRSGQPPVEDDRQSVAAHPVSSTESSGISASKDVPPPSRTRNVPPMRTSQGTGADTSLGLHSTEELHAQQLHRNTSFQKFAKPSTYSAPPLKQPGVSMSSSISRVAPALTKPTSSLARPQRDILSSEPDARSGGAPINLPRPPDQEKGTTNLDEQRRSKPSAGPHKLPSPPKPAVTKAGPTFLPQPESGPHSLGRSKSRMLDNEGVERESMRVAALPISKKESKRTTVTEESESHREDTATDSDGAARRRAEPTPLSSFVQHVKHPPRPPSESVVKRTYSSSVRHDSDSSSVPLSDANGPRGTAGRPTDSVLSLDRTETSITPPSASLSTQSQPKVVVRARSNNNSTISGADHQPRPPNVMGDLQLRASPSMSPSMKPSKSMQPVWQPHSAAVPLFSQDGSPSTQILREPGGDTPSRPPENHGETHKSSRVQAFSTPETIENKPRAKPSDRNGLDQPSTQMAPAIVKAPSRMKEAYASQSQHGHLSSERQFSQYENTGAPPKQNHAGPNIMTQSQVSLSGRNGSVTTSAQIAPELIKTSSNLTGNPRSEFSIPNEQGHTSLPGELDNLLRSSENAAATDSSAPQHHSQSVPANRAVPVNRLNSTSPDFERGNTLNGSTSSLMAINTLGGKSRKLSIENLTRTGGERTTTEPPLTSFTPERNVGLSASRRHGSGPFPSGLPISATPSGASVGLKRTVSTAKHSRHQQPRQPSPSSSDTSLPKEDRTALFPDVPSGYSCEAPRVDATRETRERVSDSMVELKSLESLSPVLLPTANNHLKASSTCSLTVSRASTDVRRNGAATNTLPVQHNCHPPMPSQSQPMAIVQPAFHPAPTTQKANRAGQKYSWPTTGGRTLDEARADPQPDKGRTFWGCIKFSMTIIPRCLRRLKR